MANSVTRKKSWEHTELEWNAFLETITGSEKKTIWRDKKKENKSRVVFVVVGNFVELFHNDAIFFKNEYGFCVMGENMAHTGFKLNDLEEWKTKLTTDGNEFCVI